MFFQGAGAGNRPKTSGFSPGWVGEFAQFAQAERRYLQILQPWLTAFFMRVDRSATNRSICRIRLRKLQLMKSWVLNSAFRIVLGLVAFPLPSAHASSPPADSVYFCTFDDYEQSRRGHSRPAAKRLADLNVGEPRTVRMIYFLPNDWPYRADVVDSMKTAIVQVQTFYREQMQAHGYGDWTFHYETDAQGEPLVHRMDSPHPYSHYVSSTSTISSINDEIERTFDLDANIYLIVLGTDLRRWHNGAADSASGSRRTKTGGWVQIAGGTMVPGEFYDPWGNVRLVAHELGHAFGLPHYFSDGAYIMSYGGPSRFPGAEFGDRISVCSAEFLSVHTYFNPAIPTAEGQPPIIELISPTVYPSGSTSVPVRFQVSDSEGLHQVAIPLVRQFCHGLAGKTNAVVEIDYDGFYTEYTVFKGLTDRLQHRLFVDAVDTEGNFIRVLGFRLAEISPYQIATLEGHSNGVTSIAFSPDGTLLASGSFDSETLQGEDRALRLWDVEKRTELAAVEVPQARDVVFSPDGSLLAYVIFDEVRLWDVASREEVATLKASHPPVSFSPDGALLASASNDRTVKLWDVAGRKEVATLKGHTSWVTSVSFSPDGALLASASNDRTVKLWDVAGRKEVATLEGHTAKVTSVSFSLDGALLASGGGWGEYTVRLWDVATQKQVATLEGHSTSVTSIAFSPDGTLLASGSRGWDETIRLWDVSTGEVLAVFSGHTHGVTSVSFSPDSTVLASGSTDRTIKLWDVSDWTRPIRLTLEIVSGNGQQGAPGATLTQPLTVEVRDQHGTPLAGTTVTFAITAGGGTLSDTTATTDAQGRAATTLTLGNQPGTNTVVATVEDLDPLTFTATGTTHADFDGDGIVGFPDFL